MKTHIESLSEYLNENGFKAAVWKDRRVYLNGFAGRKYDRDINAYIDIDEPLEEVPEVSDDYPVHPLLAGCALKVFSNVRFEYQLVGNNHDFGIVYPLESNIYVDVVLWNYLFHRAILAYIVDGSMMQGTSTTNYSSLTIITHAHSRAHLFNCPWLRIYHVYYIINHR